MQVMTIASTPLRFTRYGKTDPWYSADLVVFDDGEQRVVGTYRIRKTPELALKWHTSFAEGDGPETLTGGAFTLTDAKRGADADAARRVFALTTPAVPHRLTAQGFFEAQERSNKARAELGLE